MPSGQPSVLTPSGRGRGGGSHSHPLREPDTTCRGSFKKAFDEEKRSTVQYLLSTKQIHHGQPPFEHLRPASAPLLRCRRLPGNPPARETGLGLGHGEHTPAQPAAQLPRGLSATYLGPCKERWPSWTRGAGPEPSQMGSEDPGEEIVPFPVLGHETGITGQRLFPFARCLGTRTLRERPLWATVCGSGGQVTQSVCRCTHSPPTTRSSEPP